MSDTPSKRLLNGGSIGYAVGSCFLGAVLVAGGVNGVCAIALGDVADSLVHQLRLRFRDAEIGYSNADCADWLQQTIAFIEQPATELALPLALSGTPFQRRVWQVLREIPLAATLSYSAIAGRIGAERSARAVAAACAANTLALAVPCHRAVRSDGRLAGYRWGIERKAELLKREREALAAGQ
ncbi:methylated-DNA--[protein]-cysteine S-methyltransferase [Methylomonas koyamae]|uniref:methylated-DNA--[protein]-cysteine S-methyltransferase n=1 Tax=Methylomonas koyamae TaxID=702114 RepID=UPI0028738BD4|nr:methylated-DNA--[protein]-cysteine S-methyltransferase [Methylomonas koyamae]WNB77635.1 methylated-DNA--[protein]-cysteine S-methyltransferase [Methylomonas koyamae]